MEKLLKNDHKQINTKKNDPCEHNKMQVDGLR